MAGTAPDPSRWAAVEALFEALAEVPEDQQETALEALAAHHPVEAVAECRRLLGALARHPGLGDGLRAPALEREFPPDSRVGDWVVDGTLGRGGQGVVLRVHRLSGEFRQTGALKTLGSAVLDPEGTRRLLRERQLLAGLSHPGLPALLDAGVLDDGTPWFVQAYVEGERLDRWVARTRPDLPTRVALLRQLAAVLIHAHGRLVLHRDLKPGNVLVDGDGHAVLLDFGVASWLPAAQTRTQAGYTPAYAAPEQIRGERGSAATDVYGLGALALELLGGRAPFADFHDTAAQLRAVLEQQPAPPADLDADLAAILQKALRKEPEARYQSMAALDADLVRWQQGLPVEARAGGRRYRFRKWVRRHRLSVGASVAVFLALALGLAVALQQREHARQQQAAAIAAQQRAEQTLAVLVDLFVSAGSGNLSGRWRSRDLRSAAPTAARRSGLSVREVIDLAVEERLPDIEPAIRAPLHEAFAEVYASLGQSEAAIRQFEAALALKPGDPALRAGLLKQQLQRIALAAAALPELEALIANPGSLPRAELAAVIERGADAQRRSLNNLPAARALMDRALALYPERQHPEVLAALPETDQVALAHLLAQQGRIAVAEARFEDAAEALDRGDAILIALQGPDSEHRSRVLEGRALLLGARRDYRASLAVRREQLRLLAHRQEQQTLQAAIWFDIGILHRQMNDLEASRAAYAESLRLYDEAGLPPQAANRLALRRSLANLLMDERRYAEALAAYDAIRADTPASMARILQPLLALSRARALHGLGRYAEAERGFAALMDENESAEVQSGARRGALFAALQRGDAATAAALYAQIDPAEPFERALAGSWLAWLQGQPPANSDVASLRQELTDPAARPDRVWLSGAPLRQLCPDCPAPAAAR